MNSSGYIDTLIDGFVQHVNARPRRRIRADDIPPELREGEPEYGLYYSWRIRPHANPSWVPAVEAILQTPLPPSYRSLVTRYIFPAFHWGPLLFLANTGHSLYHEMSTVLLRNQATCRSLLESGFIQFARPLSAESDPICFDLNVLDANQEPRIVRIQQMSVFSNEKLEVCEEIAASFPQLMEQQAFRQSLPKPLPR